MIGGRREEEGVEILSETIEGDLERIPPPPRLLLLFTLEGLTGSDEFVEEDMPILRGGPAETRGEFG